MTTMTMTNGRHAPTAPAGEAGTADEVKLQVLYEDGVPCLCVPAIGLRLELTPGEAEYVGLKLARAGRRAFRLDRVFAAPPGPHDLERGRHDESLRQLRREVAEQTSRRLAEERLAEERVAAQEGQRP